jgi:hypothetical protein
MAGLDSLALIRLLLPFSVQYYTTEGNTPRIKTRRTVRKVSTMSDAVSASSSTTTFDRGRAVTKSLLGWGVVAGPFYVVVGLAQALLVPGFDLSRHALSLLLLGPLGWIQWLNLVLSGLMVLAAAVGFARLLPRRRNVWAAVFLGLYGISLVAAAIFPPDPMGGFPVGGTDATTASTSGLLHLAAGAIGFVSLAVAAVIVGTCSGARGDAALRSRRSSRPQ